MAEQNTVTIKTRFMDNPQSRVIEISTLGISGGVTLTGEMATMEEAMAATAKLLKLAGVPSTPEAPKA